MASASVQRSSPASRAARCSSSASAAPAAGVRRPLQRRAPLRCCPGACCCALLEMRARLGKAAGVERRRPAPISALNWLSAMVALDARQAFGGGDVAGIALEHVGKQRLRLGQVLGASSAFSASASVGHDAARRGRPCRGQSVASLIARIDLERRLERLAGVLELAGGERAFAFGESAQPAPPASARRCRRAPSASCRRGRRRAFVLAPLEHAADFVERLAGRGEIRAAPLRGCARVELERRAC